VCFFHRAKCSTVDGKIDSSHLSTPARGLFCAAVVLLIATINPVEDGDGTDYFGESLFGMIASAVTILVCVVHIYLSIHLCTYPVCIY